MLFSHFFPARFHFFLYGQAVNKVKIQFVKYLTRRRFVLI